MTQFDQVSVVKKANVYFDGKCVSHTVLFPDGRRKTLGVIFPSTLTFTTGAPERMELTGGRCRVRIGVGTDWRTYGIGDSFEVPANTAFDIEAFETVDYVCHFG